MEEIIEGVFHWKATHPNTGSEASCHFVAGSGTAIDRCCRTRGSSGSTGAGSSGSCSRPAITSARRPRSRRASIARSSATSPASTSSRTAPTVEGFAFGDRLADDVVALEMDSISPDDTVLHIEQGGGALLFADSVVNRGSLGFVSDGLIGDDPEAVKEKILVQCKGLLDERFEHLLFAHGDPLVGGGRPALQAFTNGRAG